MGDDNTTGAAAQRIADMQSGTTDTNQRAMDYDPGRKSSINNAPAGGLGAVAAAAAARKKAKADADAAAAAAGSNATTQDAADALGKKRNPQ
jgi:hypothetical protein